MARELHQTLSKKEQNKKKKTDELNHKKKKNVNSDDDGDDYLESDSELEEMTAHEIRKYINEVIPTTHMDKKIKAGERLYKKTKNIKNNKKVESEEEWETETDTDTDTNNDEKLVNKKTINSKNKRKKNIKNEEEYEDESEEDGDENDEENKTENLDKKKSKVNIFFTIAGEDDEDEDYDPDYDEYGEFDDYNYSTENEDDPVSSSDEDSPKNKKITKKNKKEIKDKDKENKEQLIDTKTPEQVLDYIKNLLILNPDDKALKNWVDICEIEYNKYKEKKEKKIKKQKQKNMRIFRKIGKDKNAMNDFSFYENLDVESQKDYIKKLKEINKISRIEEPYRLTLLKSSIPVEFKAAAMKKINSLKYLEPGSGEYYKLKNWVDTFMRIPFGKYQELPVTINDGIDKCHEFMENAQNTLDQAVYGLTDAKMQIMQLLGQLLINPQSIGTAIAIHGPPGTGKTSLLKEGVSKILNRPFAFIALGGATDSSFLEGHSYTYEGSTWGKIAQILIDSKCMNPVIYFDELDKISDTPRGEEITGILTHLTDTTQNTLFHDKYFTEINFDLSKCLFIFSYNDETKVNPILKDRMYRIKTTGYSQKEKVIIANNYLLPKIREQVKFSSEDIIIPDITINYIIEQFCKSNDTGPNELEQGVRNLKRCLEIIHTKLNLFRLMKRGTKLLKDSVNLDVIFPFTVTKDIVDKLIILQKNTFNAQNLMYV